MDAFPQSIQSKPTYNRLSQLSFVMGLLTSIFPVLAFYFLVARNGGPGYVQSLFCGVPFAFASILTGIVSLALTGGSHPAGVRKGAWMAVLGIVLGVLFFGIACILVLILLGPFLMGRAG